MTWDGFIFQVDLKGLDPNGFILYGNKVGFLHPDGKTPLYHDLVAGDNLLTTPQAGVLQARQNARLFFNRPDPNLPESLLTVPQLPTVNNVSFVGTGAITTSYYSTGGEFHYTGNVGGIAEIIISRDGVDFDPTNPNNRVLRSDQPLGVNTIFWDGKANNGTPFPVGTGYKYRVNLHAGEYHFPLLDAENSVYGGPGLTMLNPPGGVCPPAINRSDPFLGFNTAISPTQRAFGDGTGNGFGNWKGLDLWTFFPSSVVTSMLDIVAQPTQDLTIFKSHTGNFNVGSNGLYTLTVSNVGTLTVTGPVTVTDILPAGVLTRPHCGRDGRRH